MGIANLGKSQRNRLPLMEDEKDRKADTGEACGVVPAKLFAEISHRENCKNSEGDNFLNRLELRCIKFEGANTIGRNLEAIFEKGNSPTGENNFPEGFAPVLEVAVPGKSHEDVGDSQKKDRSHEGIGSCRT